MFNCFLGIRRMEYFLKVGMQGFPPFGQKSVGKKPTISDPVWLCKKPFFGLAPDGDNGCRNADAIAISLDADPQL
jgi:hypothetical protein